MPCPQSGVTRAQRGLDPHPVGEGNTPIPTLSSLRSRSLWSLLMALREHPESHMEPFSPVPSGVWHGQGGELEKGFYSFIQE